MGKKKEQKTCKTTECSDEAAYRGYCRKCYLKVSYSTIKLLKEPPEDDPWEPIVAEDEDDQVEISRIINKKAA